MAATVREKSDCNHLAALLLTCKAVSYQSGQGHRNAYLCRQVRSQQGDFCLEEIVKKSPRDVFTPRSTSVNHAMYINRDSLERHLYNSIFLDKLIFLHGESGNGKTWLYKKVLSDRSVYFESMSLGLANSSGSLSAMFSSKLGDFGESYRTNEGTKSGGSFKPAGMGLEHTFETSFEYFVSHPLVALLKAIRR
jgi:hypothetical protein